MVKRTVRMGDTDATGQIYFTQLQKMAIEVFEEFLEGTSYAISKLVSQGDFLYPIVHVEADYLAPIALGDVLEIKMQLDFVGKSSFRIDYTFYKEAIRVAEVKIIQVVVSKVSKKSVDIPKCFLELFKQ